MAFDGDVAIGWCQKVPASFLYSATRGTFEKAGFDYERPKGKNHCVMRKIVAPE